MIPVFLKLQLRGKTEKGLNLWLPVFLVWILLLFFMILLLPLVVMAAIFTWRTGLGKSLLLFYPRFWQLLFNLSGLRLDIKSRTEKIFLNFL